MRFRACAYKRTPRRANQPELVFKKVESAQGCRDEGIGYCCRNNCVSVQIAGTDMSLFARLPRTVLSAKSRDRIQQKHRRDFLSTTHRRLRCTTGFMYVLDHLRFIQVLAGILPYRHGRVISSS